MKILYIGHYKENSGWSNAAINYILALDSVGVDVVCRNIKLTNIEAHIPERILELEQKKISNIDYCIQHVLPHHLVGSTKFKKNIAYFVCESYPIVNTSWFENLMQMDEVWVPNQTNAKDLIKHRNKDVKIKVIPHTFDLNKYNILYPKINIKSYNNTFKFYTITDLNSRKNLESILKCFYSEFNGDEQVILVIKAKKHGFSSDDLHKYIKNITTEIKQNLRIYKDTSLYPLEIIITTDLDDSMIYSLHQTCDCFIGISHGEGWSIPAFDAMCFGKTPICSNEGGPQEFIPSNDDSCGKLINGIYNICDHSDAPFPEIFTGKLEWFIPSESETKSAMRYYYENRNNINRTNGLKIAEKYNYNNIGNMIKEYLNV